MRHMAYPKFEDNFVWKNGDSKNIDNQLQKSNGATLNEIKWQANLRNTLEK